MEPDIDFGERVVRWREHRGLTQAALAAKITKLGGQCSPSAVAQWELNQTAAAQSNMQPLADALEVTLAQFWGRVPSRKKRAS